MRNLYEQIRSNSWPRTNEPAGAARAILFAVLASIVAAPLSLIFALQQPDLLGSLTWPATAVAIVYFATIGWLTFRGSRAAALIGLIVSCLVIAYLVADGSFPDPRDDRKAFAAAIAFPLLYLNGVRGTFAMNRIKRSDASVA